MRLFIAIPFPEEIKSVLTGVQEQLRGQGVRADYTRPENMHLTLAFIGESGRLKDIRQAMTSLDAAAFSITIGGSGRFGNLLWAGVRRSEELSGLANSLRERLRELDFSVDTRPFRAHITLARRADADKSLRPDIPERTMKVDRIVLMKSERLRGVLTYTPLFEKRLLPGGGSALDKRDGV